MKTRFLCLAGLMLAAMAGQAQAGFLYMRSTVGQPWGVDTNEQAMDTAFGSGAWQDLRYETASPATVFSNANSFAFLEGGDNNADELEAFLIANIATIEGWVANGGSLFLNAAPNEGDGMSFGFGVTLNPIYNFEDSSVNAVNPLHPIFNGPSGPVSLSYTGGAFAHTDVTGPFTALLDDPNGDVFLAEKSYGLGHVIFGGMTTTNFHSPQPDAFNLRVNILNYGASQANQAAVPEPASLAMWGLGAIGMVVARRKRQQKKLTA